MFLLIVFKDDSINVLLIYFFIIVISVFHSCFLLAQVSDPTVISSEIKDDTTESLEKIDNEDYSNSAVGSMHKLFLTGSWVLQTGWTHFLEMTEQLLIQIRRE